MNFLELLKHKKEIYKNFKKVISPALSSEVFFNSKGFNHITFKNNRNPRTVGDQINRLNIIDIAYELIKHSNTYQEYEKVNLVDGKIKEYWGIIAIFKNTKIKVILRKIGNGNIHFWSVIPAHTTSEKRDGNFKMKGNVDND